MTERIRRMHAWALAEEMVDGVVDRQIGGLLLVEGEPGIGKSTLLDAIAERAAAAGATVGRGASDPLDRFRPFGSLVTAMGVAPEADDGLVVATRARLDQLLEPTGGGPDRISPLQIGSEGRSAVVEAIAELVEIEAATRPLVLALDDVQWADDATVSGLLRLLRIPTQLPVLLVLALRDAPRSPGVAELAAAAHAAGASVRLEAWNDDEMRALVSVLTSAEPDDELLRVADQAAGNAFLVTELVAALRQSERLQITDGVARVDGPVGLPVSPEVIVSRLADLSDELQDAARIGALLGVSFSVEELAYALAAEPAAAARAVDGLLRARVLEADEADLRFRHELLREAVLSLVPASTRGYLHLQIAHRLRDAGQPAIRVAAHYMLATGGPDDSVVPVLRAAAAEVIGAAPGLAAELLERALAGVSPTDPERHRLTAELVDAHMWSGDTTAAVDLALRTLREPLEPAVAARLHETAARALVVQGHPADAVHHALAAVIPGREAWAAALSATFRVFALDLDGAMADGDRALDTPAAASDLWAAALGHVALGWVDNVRGFFTSAAQHFDDAVRFADASPGGEAHRLLPHLFRSFAYANAGRMPEAQASIRSGLELVDRLGTVWAVPFYHYAEGQVQWTLGELDDLLSECEAGLACARDHDAWLGAPWAYATAAAAHLYRGRLDEADTSLRGGEELLAAGGIQYGVDWIVWIRGLWLEATGDRAGATDALLAAWEMARGLQAAAALALVGPDLIRITMLDGEVAQAKEYLAALASDDGGDRAAIDVLLLRCRGLVDGDVDAIAEARRLHEHQRRRLEVVLDDEAAVLALSAAGRLDDARIQLEQCRATADRVGATLVADRAAKAAARAGVRVGAPRRVRTSYGWTSLTETERLVTELVASGETNPEIAVHLGVSRRTVESHLYRIFPKLGVRNRTELALWASSHATD